MKRLFLIVLLTTQLFSQPIPITSNITAYWKFDESFPTNFTVLPIYADATGRGNTLTVFPDQRAQPSALPFRLGANATGGQTLDGSMAGCGKWNRAWTSGELTALAGGEMWPFSTTTSLQDAKAFYLLNEASNSATYADATGRGNTLTRSGITTQVTGPGGSGHGTKFTSGAYLEANPPTSDLQSGNFTFSVGCWVNLNTKPSGGQSVMWGQVTLSGTPHTGEVIYYQGTTDNFNIDLGNDVNLFANGVLPISGTTPATGTWYFVGSTFNATSSIMAGTVNNGTAATFARNIQPGAVPAKINNGAQFSAIFQYNNTLAPGWDAAVVSSAQGATSNDVTFGNNSRTVWFWFKATNTTPVQTLAGFYDQATTNIDWLVQLAGGQLFFLIGNAAGSFQDCSVAFSDTSTFHLIVAWFDAGFQTLSLNLDNGASSCSHVLSSLTPATTTYPLYIGSNKNSGVAAGAAQQFPGIIDEMGIADGTPSTSDLNILWNGGEGWTFPVSGTSGAAMRGSSVLRGNAVIR
jgi:hypothetical protein